MSSISVIYSSIAMVTRGLYEKQTKLSTKQKKFLKKKKQGALGLSTEPKHILRKEHTLGS